MSTEPHHRYFELSSEEQRQVREMLGRKVRAGKAPDRELIESAINVILARRSMKRGPGPREDTATRNRRRSQ